MNKMSLVLGDWSGDGHEKTEKVFIETNKFLGEVVQAYKDSCELTHVSFNDIANDYGDNHLDDEIAKIFTELKCPLLEEIENEDNYLHPNLFARLWFWFISLSLPDFQFKIIKDDTPTINGYWSEDFNESFGYGLYE